MLVLNWNLQCNKLFGFSFKASIGQMEKEEDQMREQFGQFVTETTAACCLQDTRILVGTQFHAIEFNPFL